MAEPDRDRTRYQNCTAFAQIAAVGSLAFAQPVFSALGAQEFVVVGWTRWEAVMAGVLCIAFPSAAIVIVEWLVGRARPRLREVLHAIVVGCLAAAWVTGQVKQGHPESGGLISLSFVVSAAVATVAFLKVTVLRSFCTALVVLPGIYLAGLALEPFSSPIAFDGTPELGPRAPGAAPVVVVVLDELPTISLTDGRGRLNRRLAPNLASFADDATWFPNATSVSDETTRAVPALVSGRFPDPEATTAPRANLFTLLARSHTENVQEVVTSLCPASICSDRASSAAQRLAGVPGLATELSLRSFLPRRASDILLGGDSAPIADAERRRAEFAQDIRKRPGRPQFHFLHLMLPHAPWARLPDGRRYTPALPQRSWLPGFAVDPVFRFPLVENDRLARNPGVVRQAHQAHLAQVSAADRQIGRVLRRLRRTGQYHRSLVVVTADHGASFRPGDNFRRLTRTNAAEILGVPLMIKRPAQRRGSVDHELARTTDLLPTIAREAGVRLRWRVDGRPLFRAPQRPRLLRAVSALSGKESAYAPRYLARRRRSVQRHQAAAFGRGTDAVEVFQLGPRQDLLGLRPRSVRDATLVRVPVSLGPVEGSPTASDAVPGAVGGTVGAGRPGQPLAVVTNGRVVATTHSYRFQGEQRFSALLPPKSVGSEPEPVQVMQVRAGGG